MLKADGFLGTGAPLVSDISLIAQVIFLIALTIGVIAQRKSKYAWHDRIQTTVVLLNYLFVIFVMVRSFHEQQVASTLLRRPGDPYFLSAGVHAGFGTITVLLSSYALLAGHKILPRHIGKLRYWMWATYGFWTATVLLGITTYTTWYILDTGQVVEIAEVRSSEPDAETGLPTVRRALIQNFAFEPVELSVVAGTTVTWLNQDGAPHNVTFADGSVASENFFQGEAFEVTFDEPGAFQIYCSLHGNPGSGMSGVVNVLEATEENVAAVAEEPTPDKRPPEPTPAPIVPPAPIALIEAPTASDTIAGILAFRDGLAPSDSAVLVMSDVGAPPAGQELHAWLTAADGRVLDIGVISPDASGNVSYAYQEPDHQNLMALFDGVQLTFEPEGDDDPEPATVVYSGRQAPFAYELIRQITAGADTPSGLGYGVASRLQAEEVTRHAVNIRLADESGNLADAKRHAEHVINVLEGEEGEFFGDWDGAFGLQNPGDGFGLIPYIHLLKETALASASAEDATRAIVAHAAHVDIATDSALGWAAAVRDAGLAIIEANSLEEIGPLVEEIDILSQRLLLGEDTDGDGNISLVEGGIFIAYQHAQYMGAVGIVAGNAAAVADPIALGEDDLETQLSEGEVVIDMRDFEYSPTSLTIPAGTAVRIVNIGQAQHSVTADDGSFDTGLLGSDEEVTLTFDEPGFHPFYCLLHGAPDGVGMSGTISVVEAGTPPLEEEAQQEPEPEEAPDSLEYSIEMVDFTYSQLDLVVPAGAWVTWFNTGQFEHSATADDTAWDTTLLANGEQSTLTFDEPGRYQYYCTLHGAPGGQGMSAVITVVEPEALGSNATALSRPPP
jgi:plastocyanin/uncharacterized membrane protein YozB (DUF420 family)